MKEWFQYEYGYVNIDSDNVYLTNTGNWSEVRELQEKGIQKASSFRKFRISFSIVLLAAISGGVFLSKFLDTGRNTFFILGIPVTLYFFYNYLKRETGSAFKIPISKIISIEANNKTIAIRFYDSANDEDEEVLYNVSVKGQDLLKNLLS